ncbi:hypothetical protein SKAU_G00163270 [Synaphobranchus kaupii]|uniref:Uncharacterized protein n=1 Tax=Synaphobranchus kaupii TaxID=118154 RepID=A0A9Q1FJF2_SYNKA|nr:hypothetical protein SKAU_G00163270 [Synaphobranchus kaupii]
MRLCSRATRHSAGSPSTWPATQEEEEERGERGRRPFPFLRPANSVWGRAADRLTAPDQQGARSSRTSGPLLRCLKPGGFSTPHPAVTGSGVTPGTLGAANSRPIPFCPALPRPALPCPALPSVLQAPVPSLGP